MGKTPVRSLSARVAIWAGAALLVLAIGLSRIYLGVHYPSDVVGGWILGAAIGAALHTRLTPRIELATTLLSSAILAAFAFKIAADALAAR